MNAAPTITIDRIMRISEKEFWIIYLERPPVKITSTGKAEYLLEWLLEAPYASA